MTNEEAIKALKRIRDEAINNFIGDWQDYEAFDIALKALADHKTEPKQGEWERIPYSFVGGFRCSCCGTKTLEKHWNFCPNCGAKMKGASDEN